MTTLAEALQNTAEATSDAALQLQTTTGVLNNEIGSLATAAGLDPNQDKGTRVLHAIRSGGIVSATESGTTAGLLQIATAVPLKAYRTGMRITIKLTRDILGATNFRHGDLATVPLRQLSGAHLQRLDYIAGDVIEIVCKSPIEGFVVVTPPTNLLIDVATTKTVFGDAPDFADLNSAFAWLKRRLITTTGSVIFDLAEGVSAGRHVVSAPTIFSHPDGARVTIRGKPQRGTLPAGPSLSFTGNSESARNTDEATNLTLLRASYATEIFLSGTGRLEINGQLGNLQDVLLSDDGTRAQDSLAYINGAALLTRVACVGSGFRGIHAENAYLTLAGPCYAIGAASTGWSASNAATISIGSGASMIGCANGSSGVQASRSTVSPAINAGSSAKIYLRGNAFAGAYAFAGSTIIGGTDMQSVSNGSVGFYAESNSSIQAAGAISSGNSHGFFATSQSFINAVNSRGSDNTGFSYLASNGSTIERTGGTTGGDTGVASPAVGVNGNGNSYIV